MVKSVLEAAGFVEGATYKATRFLKPPATTYAIYMDSFDRRGSDDQNLIAEHTYTIELYSYVPDATSEAAIESALDQYALPFSKQDRYWLNEEQLYQVVYTFDYIEK